jgi:hypothetical protein
MKDWDRNPAGLNASALRDLRLIGDELDKDNYPVGERGGILKPGSHTAPTALEPGKGMEDGNGTQGSSTGPWQGAAGGQGPAGGSWPADPTASLVGRSDPEALEAALAGLQRAYPGAQVERREDGFWILARSELLKGSKRWAQFVLAVPNSKGWALQSWAFWQTGRWIGPRHTNFPTGSICAFFPGDGTWRMGDPFVTLLDLYSLWAVRQLHLEVLGRWPGRQVARWAFERIIENKPGELCGCGSLALYESCCKSGDLSGDYHAMREAFLLETRGGKRAVPSEVLHGLSRPADLPLIRQFAYPPGVLH